MSEDVKLMADNEDINYKDIPEYPHYIIYKDGRVFSKRKGSFLKHSVPGIPGKSREYRYVNLGHNGEVKSKYIHRLLAQSFIPNPEYKPQVNHKNGNKLDNRLENLEWATCSENMIHAHRVLHARIGWTGKFGRDHIRSKEVSQINIKNGEIMATFGSGREAERLTGICDSLISLAATGKRPSAGGFIWKRTGVNNG